MNLIMAKMHSNASNFPSDFSSDDLNFAFASASFGLVGVAIDTGDFDAWRGAARIPLGDKAKLRSIRNQFRS
jgi:hypothetical protein